MKNAWIEKNKATWPILLACEVLFVSVSRYFDHQRRCKQASPRSRPGGGARVSNEALLAQIRANQVEAKGEYGWPRVWKELLARGVSVGQERVPRIMKKHGIKAKGKG